MRDAGNNRKFPGEGGIAPGPALSSRFECNYCYYMKPVHLKVARIGNSRGVRIPATTLERYHIGSSVVMEELSDGILLRPTGHADTKLSWEETAKSMAAEPEDWTEWDEAVGDGIDDLKWESVPRPRSVAEEDSPAFKASRRLRKR
jgi:antitoxin component of MazEF toxin-antitoxin module